MKTYLALLLISGQIAVAAAQDTKTPYLTKALNTGIKSVYVTTSGGSIQVSGETGQEPRVEVYISGNNGSKPSTEEIKKRLEEDYTLDISVTDDEVRAVAKNKHQGNWDWRKSLSIAFKVYVPQNSSTNLTTSGGSIHLSYLNGDEKFETSGGSLSIDHLSGKVRGQTSGGSIHLDNSKDDIDLETSGGSIHASNSSGTIKLETSGGSLSLNNLNGNIKAETSGGGINAQDIKGELKAGTSGGSINLSGLACSLDTYTSGGSIHVQMTQATKYVKIDASGGHVDLQLPSKQGFDLDIHGQKVNADLASGFEGTKDKDHVEGKLNGGGVAVSVNGSNNVNLSLN